MHSLQSLDAPRTVRTHTPIAGRILSQDEAMSLGKRLLDLIATSALGWRPPGVTIEHTVRSVLKVTNDHVLSSHDGDEVSVHFDGQGGSGIPMGIGTNQLDDASLRQVVAKAAAMAPKVDERPPSRTDDPEAETFKPRTFTPVSLWHDPTIAAMDTIRGETAPALVEQIRASQLMGVATVGLSARSALYLYRGGLTAWSTETDGEVTVTARTLDGKTSGWSGQASRNWSDIRPETIARDAIDLANRGRNIVVLEPGRRVAILSATAVGQIVRSMAGSFDAYATDEYQATPFALIGPGGRKNKLGMRVTDARIMLSSDPTDPLGGYPPFFEAGSFNGMPGLPIAAATWIDRGVLKNLSYNMSYANQRGKTWNELPFSMRLNAVPGTKTSTVEEMIANCEDGIYVNRFSSVSVVDGKSGLMTGVTRDGCFRIKNGKFDRPIKNFRFIESPMFMFNRLLGIGTPSRVAFGYAPPATRGWTGFGSWPPTGRDSRWPMAPIIVPPMMVQDFNFSALSDAV